MYRVAKLADLQLTDEHLDDLRIGVTLIDTANGNPSVTAGTGNDTRTIYEAAKEPYAVSPSGSTPSDRRR